MILSTFQIMENRPKKPQTGPNRCHPGVAKPSHKTQTPSPTQRAGTTPLSSPKNVTPNTSCSQIPTE